MGEGSATVIACPHCGREIALDEALSRRIRLEMQKEVDAQLAKRQSLLQEAEAKVKQEKARLEEQARNLSEETARRVAGERASLTAKLRKEARGALRS